MPDTTAPSYELGDRAPGQQFSADFPHGFRLIPTSANGLLCGLFAIIHSLQNQAPSVRIPTVEDLQTVAEGAIAARFRDTGLEEDFSRNLSYDYVAAVLREWGSQNGHNLQLGLHWANREPMIFPVESDQAPTMIWIHNDNQQSGDTYGHYSGMARCIYEDGNSVAVPVRRPVQDMEEQWERHRSVIKTLYISQNMTLKEVMNHMSTVYQFQASKSHYERHLKKWSLTKNKKGNELIIIAHKVDARNRVGKSSVVRYNGSVIDPDGLRRIVSRYGLASRVQRATRAATPPTPPGYQITSPRPESEQNAWDIKMAFSCFEDFLRVHHDRLLVPLPQIAASAGTYLDPLVYSQCPDGANLTHEPSTLPQSAPGLSHTVANQLFTTISTRHFTEVLPILYSFYPAILFQRPPCKEAEVAQYDNDLFNSAYARILLFCVANNFSGIYDFRPHDIWAYLKRWPAESLLHYIQSVREPLSNSFTENVFRCALEAGDAGAIEQLLGDDLIEIDVNNQILHYHGRRFTALERAALRQDVAMSRILLHYGADVNKTYDTGVSGLYGPLGCAIRPMVNRKSEAKVNQDLLKILLLAGARIYRRTIELLIHEKRFELLEMLLKLSLTRLEKWTSKRVARLVLTLRRSMQTSTFKLLEVSNFDFKAAYEDTRCKRCRTLLPSDFPHDCSCDGHEFLDNLYSYCEDADHFLELSGLNIRQAPIAEPFGSDYSSTVSVISEDLESSTNSEYVGCPCFLEAKESIGCRKFHENSIYTALAKQIKNFEARISDCIQRGTRRQTESRHRRPITFSDEDLLAFGLDTLLAEELQQGNIAHIKSIIQVHRIRSRKSDWVEPFLRAVSLGGVSIVAYLLSQLGRTVVAVKQRRPEALIDCSKFPCIATFHTATPLMIATANCDHAMILRLIDAGANINPPERQPQLRIQNGHPTPFNYKACKWFKRIESKSPLLVAAMIGDLSTVNHLFSLGADPYNPFALLASMVRTGGDDITKSLIFHFKERYPRGRLGYGTWALHFALRKENLALARLLIRNLTYNVFCAGDTEDPLIMAADVPGSVSISVVHELLAIGADPNVTSHRMHTTPMALAAMRRKGSDLIELLGQYGALINHRYRRGRLDKEGPSPLEIACGRGNARAAKWLLEHGADPNLPCRDLRHRSALHCAARGGYAGIVTLLIEHGADIHHRAAGRLGTTALECAAENGRLDTVQLLLSTETGSLGHWRNELNRAIKLARSNGHFGVVHLFQQHRFETNDEISNGSECHGIDDEGTNGGRTEMAGEGSGSESGEAGDDGHNNDYCSSRYPSSSDGEASDDTDSNTDSDIDNDAN